MLTPAPPPSCDPVDLWVYTIDGQSLRAAIAKFPPDARRLTIVARKWTLRRAVVRAAERACYEAGRSFRGRQFPIYAKELCAKILLWQEERDRNGRRRKLDKSAFRLRSIMMMNKATDPMGKKYDDKPASQRGRTLRRSLTAPVSRVRDTSLYRKSGKNAPRPKSMTRAELKAANSFGLHLRQEQLAAAQTERNNLPALFDEVRRLNSDVVAMQDAQSKMVSMLQHIATAVGKPIVEETEGHPDRVVRLMEIE